MVTAATEGGFTVDLGFVNFGWLGAFVLFMALAIFSYPKGPTGWDALPFSVAFATIAAYACVATFGGADIDSIVLALIVLTIGLFLLALGLKNKGWRVVALVFGVLMVLITTGVITSNPGAGFLTGLLFNALTAIFSVVDAILKFGQSVFTS